MTPNVCILDYGSGNVRSVYNMLRMVTHRVVLSNSIQDVARASHLVLPGVGAFPRAMELIHSSLPLDELTTAVLHRERPFLGICVGMQVLAEVGEEFEETPGLGWISGRVKKLQTDQRLPHIGWNSVRFVTPEGGGLAVGIPEEEDFYFVHSYAFVPSEPTHCLATTDYAGAFCSVVRQGNMTGVQFHPEKSQESGLQFLTNFLSL